MPRPAMHVAWFIIGAAILVALVVDSLWTSLWVDGHAGPLTGHFTDWSRRLIWRLAGNSHRAMSTAGPVILVASVAFWGLLLWVGWTVIFSASPASVLDAHTRAPASLASRFYFIGYTISTMGNGDYTPGTPFWEVCTTVASLSGLFLLTLSVTYVLAVLEAVVQKRSFASQVRSLGPSAEDFLLRSWDGSSFRLIEIPLMSLAEQLNLVTEQHTAYPLLHHYHASDERQAVPTNLAVLMDVLMVLESGVAAEVRPAPSVLTTGRESVDDFLRTLKEAYIDRSRSEPPRVDLLVLQRAGIPVVPGAEWERALGKRDEYRRLLLGFLEDERRTWPRYRDAGVAPT